MKTLWIYLISALTSSPKALCDFYYSGEKVFVSY